MSSQGEIINVGLVSLKTRYKEQYGNDLVAFAKGDLTVEAYPKEMTMLCPQIGLLAKYNFTTDLLNVWLGIHGNNPKQHFIDCVNLAKHFAEANLDTAYFVHKRISDKQHERALYKFFGKIAEPLKQIKSQEVEESEAFIAMKSEVIDGD